MSQLGGVNVACLALLISAFGCTSQPPPTKPTANSPTTPTTSATDEAYIPRDLDDCFATLDRMLNPEDREQIRTGEIMPIEMHHGLGRHLRNEWGLWAKSRLWHYFHAMGLSHPDDMSGVILDSYARHLQHKPLRVEEQIREYQRYWQDLRRGETTATRRSSTTQRSD